MKHIIDFCFIGSFFIISAVYSADFSTKLPPSPTLSPSSHSSDDEKFKFPQLPESAIKPQAKVLSNIPLTYFNPGQDEWEQQQKATQIETLQQKDATNSTKKRRLCTWCCSYFFGYKPDNKND